jgi:hypothetical protein
VYERSTTVVLAGEAWQMSFVHSLARLCENSARLKFCKKSTACDLVFEIFCAAAAKIDLYAISRKVFTQAGEQVE